MGIAEKLKAMMATLPGPTSNPVVVYDVKDGHLAMCTCGWRSTTYPPGSRAIVEAEAPNHRCAAVDEWRLRRQLDGYSGLMREADRHVAEADHRAAEMESKARNARLAADDATDRCAELQLEVDRLKAAAHGTEPEADLVELSKVRVTRVSGMIWERELAAPAVRVGDHGDLTIEDAETEVIVAVFRPTQWAEVELVEQKS